jgi:hypothetical protein
MGNFGQMNSSRPPKNHHVVPRFYLRNFAIDSEKRKVPAVTKNGAYADWRITSIASTATEENFYKVPHLGNSAIYESDINRLVETPISTSAGWQKVLDGNFDFVETDVFDLYCLLKHFLVRTPHSKGILAELALDSTRDVSRNTFGEHERQSFQELAKNSFALDAHFAEMTTETRQFIQPFESAKIGFWITETPLITSSSPTTPIKIAWNPDLDLPLPGMTPIMHCLALTPNLLMATTQSRSPMKYEIRDATVDTVKGFNFQIAGQFMHSPYIRQLIASREHAHSFMTWGPYTISNTTERQTKFKRDADAILHEPIV